LGIPGPLGLGGFDADYISGNFVSSLLFDPGLEQTLLSLLI
jgi:hypothetical protein